MKVLNIYIILHKLNINYMEIVVKRKFKGESYTIGDMFIDGEFFCNTLEDKVRNLPKNCNDTPKYKDCTCKEKIKAETAIPEGVYKVVLSYSNRFKKILPEILNVPHFLGIRIHSGNTDKDTEGCILVGENLVKGKVINSKVTMEKLMKKLNSVKDINITIQ